jgi:hypothetical protein
VIDVLNEISYMLIFGKPLIMYLGITVLILFLATGTVGYLVMHNKTKLTFNAHKRLAMIAITVAIIHGTLGVLAYL